MIDWILLLALISFMIMVGIFLRSCCKCIEEFWEWRDKE